MVESAEKQWYVLHTYAGYENKVMAKRFSELGIKREDSEKIFNCQQVSITDILNSEIEVIGFLPNVKTKHGEGRYLVHFKQVDNGAET